MLKKGEELHKILDEVEKKEIELQKRVDQIKKIEMVLSNRNEEILKKLVLVEQQFEVWHSYTLVWRIGILRLLFHVI